MTATALVRDTPRRAVLLAAAVGSVVTLVSLLPLDSVAYHSTTLHVAIETGATFVALVCAVLVFGRFLRSSARSELVLAASLLLLALTNLCFSVVPWLADDTVLGSFETWTPVAGRLLGAIGLAAGAWSGVTYVTNVRRTAAWAVGAIVGIVALIGLLGAVLAPHLPVGIDQDVAPSAFGPDLVGEPALLVCQAVGLIVYAIAALGFARRAERGGDELMSWLAAGSTLAAFARLNYFLFPSINSEWVYTGDFLRVGFYVLVLIGALREISAYQRELAELAVHRERRRIARELHDGLAQELAFISSHARRSSTQADASMSRIADAAARALDESRQAIATLARPVDASLDRSVAQAAHEVAARHGLDVTLELAPGVRAADATHDALMRIVREAIHNAARHGGASTVTVGLAVSDGVRLTVEDDGKGLRAHARNGAGFGLVSMRERAEALGGTLELRAAERGGVRVEVELP